MKRLVKNKAMCKLCGDIIESKFQHDFVRCKCGEIFVDGGLSYTRRGATLYSNVIELSEYEEEEKSDD